MATATGTITDTAKAFFEACETGQGWAGCSAYCVPNASFAAQAVALADIHTVADYAEWMKGLLVIIPDGGYVVMSFATIKSAATCAPMACSPERTAAQGVRCRLPAIG